MRPNPVETVLAMSPTGTRFRTMTTSELADCQRIGDLHYCTNQNFYDQRNTKSCLISLWDSDSMGIRDNCPMILQPQSDYLLQNNATSFLLFHPVTAQIDLHCEGGKLQKWLRFQGVKMVRVPVGCTASTRSYTFESSLSVWGSPYQVEVRDLNMTDIMGESMREIFQSATKSEIERLHLVGSKEGMTFKDLEAEFSRERLSTWITIGIGTAVGFVVLFILILIMWSCWNKLKPLNVNQRERVVYHAGRGREEEGVELNPINP